MAMIDMEGLSAQFRGLEGRHPGHWPILPRALLAVLALAAVLGLGWYFFWDAQLIELEQGKAEEVRLRQDFQSKVQQAVNLDALRKQKAEVGEYVATLERQLPSKAEMDALLSDINQAGVGRGLQFELFKPGQSLVKDYYAELPIEIKISGNYHDIASFTSDIAHMPRIVTLNNMSLETPRSNTLTLSAVAKTFRYLDGEELATRRQAQAQQGGRK